MNHWFQSISLIGLFWSVTLSFHYSMDNLEKFVKDLLDGKLKAYLKSEPIPESNDDPVKVGKMPKLEAATAFHNFMCSEF